MSTVVAPASRRQEILAIAAAGFARAGFEGCSVRDIAEEANILSGSLYHHFSSKDEMVIEILDHYWDALFAGYARVLDSNYPCDVAVAALVMASVQVAEECPAEVRILHQDWHYLESVVPNLDYNMKRVEQTFTYLIESGVSDGVFRADVDPAIAYRTIMGAVAWVTRWYRPEGALTMTQIGEAQARLWVDGLRVGSSAR